MWTDLQHTNHRVHPVYRSLGLLCSRSPDPVNNLPPLPHVLATLQRLPLHWQGVQVCHPRRCLYCQAVDSNLLCGLTVLYPTQHYQPTGRVGVRNVVQNAFLCLTVPWGLLGRPRTPVCLCYESRAGRRDAGMLRRSLFYPQPVGLLAHTASGPLVRQGQKEGRTGRVGTDGYEYIQH